MSASVEGDVAAVEAAVSAGVAAVKALPGRYRVRSTVLPQPDESARNITMFRRGSCMTTSGSDPDHLC